MVTAAAGGTRTPPGGPVLVYSKYDFDLDRFRRVLGEALPGVVLNYAGSPEEAAPYLADAEILYGWGFSAELLRRMPKLRWVQKMGAGVDDIIGTWPFGTKVLLTRTDGRLIATRMIEYVLAAILDKSLKLGVARAQQREQRWSYIAMGSIRELTIGIAGLGEIGSGIASSLAAFGAHVVGWRRSQAESEGVAELFVGDAGLEPFAACCDVLVLVLPLTSDTSGIFGEKLLMSLKPGAHVINVGRGGVLDEAGLLRAIETGAVSHATLDVFATEPLPQDHPFWTHPAISITPHVCGPLVPEDVAPHFVANFAAFTGGRPLRNTIDVARQY